MKKAAGIPTAKWATRAASYRLPLAELKSARGATLLLLAEEHQVLFRPDNLLDPVLLGVDDDLAR